MNKRGFTLIELLVVIAIIALLIGILLPALGQARCSARKLVGGTNHRTVGQGMYLYAEQFDDFTPASHTYITRGNGPNARWAYVWMAQVREALGGIDSGSMESFLNPSAPKEFPIEWKSFFAENETDPWAASTRLGGAQFTGVAFGYEPGELMVGQERINVAIAADPETDGLFTFSMGLNETGVGTVQQSDPTPGRDRDICLGVGEHALPTFAGQSADAIEEVKAAMGPKLSTWADPANFIVTGDSTVDAESDPQVSPGRPPFENVLPASYCGGATANFAFGDGHVESLNIEDIILSEENKARTDDPTVKGLIRKWNNDASPNEELWNRAAFQ